MGWQVLLDESRSIGCFASTLNSTLLNTAKMFVTLFSVALLLTALQVMYGTTPLRWTPTTTLCPTLGSSWRCSTHHSCATCL